MRTFQSILLASLFALTSAACVDEADPRLTDLVIHESEWMDWQTAEPTFDSAETGLVVNEKKPDVPDPDVPDSEVPDEPDVPEEPEVPDTPSSSEEPLPEEPLWSSRGSSEPPPDEPRWSSVLVLSSSPDLPVRLAPM